MVGSEVYSSEVKKTEVLMENCRRAIGIFPNQRVVFVCVNHLSSGLRIKENKEVYEGEVTELTPEEAADPLGGTGKVRCSINLSSRSFFYINHVSLCLAPQTVSHVVIGLKTTKGTKQLKLDASIYENMQKEKVVVGDVIYIEANTGAVKVIGFSLCCLSHALSNVSLVAVIACGSL